MIPALGIVIRACSLFIDLHDLHRVQSINKSQNNDHFLQHCMHCDQVYNGLDHNQVIIISSQHSAISCSPHTWVQHWREETKGNKRHAPSLSKIETVLWS